MFIQKIASYQKIPFLEINRPRQNSELSKKTASLTSFFTSSMTRHTSNARSLSTTEKWWTCDNCYRKNLVGIWACAYCGAPRSS